MRLRSVFALGAVPACRASSAQGLRNADLSQGCDSCATHASGWSVSWQGPGVSCTRDDETLRIACQDSADAVGFVEQAVPMDAVKESVILSVSADVRTKA